MKLRNLLKKVLCFGMAATLSLGVMPAITASAEEYPAVDMFEHVKALNGDAAFKGVHGTLDSSEYAGVSHSFTNAHLDEMIFLNPVDGAEAFEFEGRTYYFNFSPIEGFIQICNSQLMTCSIQFMLRWDGSAEKAYLVDPQARVVNPTAGVASHQMYAMDVAGEGRQAFRAFWRALMEWCARNGYHIDQFILGNEVNAPNTWNYFGTTDVNTCTQKYAISFFDMYQAVREYSSVPRCSVCLDHSWTFDDMGNAIPTKTFLDNFHTKVTALNGGASVDWCLAMHIWPARLDHPAIWTSWNGMKLATNSSNTYYVDGTNLHIMTDYIKNTYGAQHRVMMTEQGFVQNQGEQIQAASLAYTYYACLYDPMVDSFMIFDENGDGMAAALLPLANEVYTKIGNGNAADQQWIADVCLPVIGVKSWAQIIPNFGGATSTVPTTPTAPTAPVTPSAPATSTPSTSTTTVVSVGGKLKEIFDEHYYADNNPDLKAAFGYDKEALWNHFVNNGLKEGRVMNSTLDVVKYRNTYADLNAAFGDNWDAYVEHYLTSGINEGRDSGITASR